MAPVTAIKQLTGAVRSCIHCAMTLSDLLAMLREPPEGELPETIYDDINAAAAALEESSAAKVLEVQAAMAELKAELLNLKAFNFDLLTAAGTESSGVDVDDVAETDEIEFALENEAL